MSWFSRENKQKSKFHNRIDGRQAVKYERLSLTPRILYLLLFCLFINIALLASQLQPVYLIFAVLAIVYQFYIMHQQRLSVSKANKIIPHWLILMVAILGSVTLAIAGRELGLLLSMVHLLCFAYTLKLFEISKRKDFYQVILLGVFVAISSLIFQQSVYFSLLAIGVVFINLLVLMTLFSPSIALSQQLKTTVKLLLLSIPLAIILFIVFPKLAPFWQVPSVKSAKVGISDRVQIGDIANLALSDDMAFRVSFYDRTPIHSQRYWRALVLDQFDGVSWQRNKSISAKQARIDRFSNRTAERSRINAEIQGDSFQYQIITEASFQPWLFALDLATSKDSLIRQQSDYTLVYRDIIRKTLSYEVQSYPDAILAKTLSEEIKANNLAIIEDANPRLVSKGRALAQTYPDKAQLIAQVLTDFNQQNYHYTLQPPLLSLDGQSHNNLDQFYFDSQAGFCEHYAASFTYLMRAAGIPARMVVGYLGGELNANANYYTVYQRDAHAWSEVWLAGQGWQRVDPTAAVNPERVERGFSSALLQEYASLSADYFNLNALQSLQWFNQLKLQMAALDYQWTRWVIGYTGEKQNNTINMLKVLAKSLLKQLNVLLYLLALGAFSVVFYWLYQHKTSTMSGLSSWHKIYQKTLVLLSSQELDKPTAMTVSQYQHFISQQRPDIAPLFAIISQHFCYLEYQQHRESQNNKRAKQLAEMSSAYKSLWWQLLLSRFKISR
jgi:transglutaminase-like putative cysteine protease